eukprot:CAMPEP_0113917556 /NCGR_PEP_ID=MMETSP0780_2-20120614/32814_1 /TAXON_ID=652834 /ORGANISM="Palpitomonas bilix" /LENGTH=93 /DNA_ID=CAMNT_0000917171 /DNA_START=2233 /DNA_END=2513 /DNA_ORIENTATION=+ /assembly_acc=CAM_ASM_000599
MKVSFTSTAHPRKVRTESVRWEEVELNTPVLPSASSSSATSAEVEVRADTFALYFDQLMLTFDVQALALHYRAGECQPSPVAKEKVIAIFRAD